MEHLHFLFYMLCLLGGLLSIAILVFAYIQKKNRLIRNYVFLLLSFSALLFSHTLGTYTFINLSVQQATYRGIRNAISIFSGTSVLFFQPYFFFGLFNIPFTKRIYLFFILLCLVYIIAYYFFVPISNIILFSVVIYCIILSIVKVNEMGISDKKQILKKYLIVSAVFIPLIIFDAFLPVFPEIEQHLPFGIMSFPAYYLTIGIMNIVYTFKYYNKINSSSPKAMNLDQYGVTKRECEVIQLLIEGRSYEDISNTLTISLSSVKTHVSNIYKKLEIKNKIELINIVKE